jgi:predicted amidohydrolase YtcJ
LLDKNVYTALDAKFNSAPTPVTAAPETPAVKTPLSQPEVLIDDDFDQARQALKDMIKKGQTAVDDIMGIARQSDHPRAFEVTGQLIKTVAETAKDLLALQKQKKDLVTVQADAPKQIGTQNNIVFSGSTNDLLKMLKQNNEKVIDADPTTFKK